MLKKSIVFLKDMYPQRDFKSLIEQPEPSPLLWRSMLREPLQELLQYWNRSGRPSNKYEHYSHAITEGFLKERWPYHQIDLIYPYNEFHKPLLSSLQKIWSKLSFNLIYISDDYSLYIDINPFESHLIPISWSDEQKLLILEELYNSFTIRLKINNIEHGVGVFLSKRARDVYQHTSCFSSL
jgi:hypothetical protein